MVCEKGDFSEYAFKWGGLLTAAAAAIIFSGGVALAEPKEFNIREQPLGPALKDFAYQSELQVLFLEDDVMAFSADGLSGEHEPEAVLKHLLDGTNLEYEFQSDGVLVVRPLKQASDRRAPGAARGVQFAQLDARSETENDAVEAPRAKPDKKLQALTITGSNIRGVEDTASPVYTFDRADIEASGYATVQQFFQTIPQNFGGNANENTAGGAAGVLGQSSGPGGGSAIDLRGLGRTATLTLVNGRRVAPAGVLNFVDVSSIPTSAIDRIEVLADGASAIYGSDAVGGVVNIILREDYDGAETSARYGAVTDGDVEEIRLAQTFGKNWDTGNVLATYERFVRSELAAEDRDFSATAPLPQTLLPDVKRHSVFAAGQQELIDGVEFSFQGYYNQRDVEAASGRATPVFNNDRVREYGGSAGVEVDVAAGWRAQLSGTYGRSATEALSVQVSDGAVRLDQSFDYRVGTVDLIADGPIFDLLDGEVLLAFGGHYRAEELSALNGSGLLTALTPGNSRDVYALFAEIFVPLVGESNRIPGVERADLTFAFRHEDYNDFGTTNDPKVGAVWSPIDGLDFRGTWGTSFRAPRLRELAGGDTASFIFPAADPILLPGGGTVPVLFVTSSFNPDLRPEEATTWTAGADIEPEFLPGLDVGLTYFDIDFQDRIEEPFGGNLFGALGPEFVSIVPRDPSLAQVLSAVNGTDFRDFFGIPLSDVRAIVDSRPRNVSAVQVRGLDFSVDYTTETDIGDLAFGFDGTYLLDWNKELVPGLILDELNTVFDPTDLKLRGSASWSADGASVALFVNHIGDSVNDQVTPEARIASWTTFDLNLQYDTRETLHNDWADNIAFSVSVINLFDRDPPFVENPLSDVNFDGTNASALGRFVAFQITKRW